ncbi:MAG: hypothetical protein ACTHZ9_03780 [Leucobacter sp.]
MPTQERIRTLDADGVPGRKIAAELRVSRNAYALPYYRATPRLRDSATPRVDSNTPTSMQNTQLSDHRRRSTGP